MNRQILMLLFTVTVIGCANAQTGLYTGLNGGFNSTWIVNQNNYGYSELEYVRTFGGSAGVVLGYRFDEQYAFQLGINYMQLGQDYFDVIKDFGPPDTIENKQVKVDTYRYISVDYVHIPLMFRYMTLRDQKRKEIINFHFMGGPVIGILTSADQYYEADITHNKVLVVLDNDTIPGNQIPDFKETPEIEPDKDYFSGIEIGFQASVGVDIYVSELIYIAPALNIYYGLTDMNSKPTRDIPDYKGASHNFYGGLNVSFIINLGESD